MRVEFFKKDVLRYLERISKKKIKLAKNNMKLAMNYISKIKDENGVDDKKAIGIAYNQIRKEMEEYESICQGAIIIQMHDSTSSYLKNNPLILEKIYNQMRSEGIKDLDEYKYSIDIEKNAKRYLREILEVINTKQKEFNLKDQTTLDVIKSIVNSIDVQPSLKREHIQLLMNSGQYLRKHNKIEEYIEKNNYNAPIEELKIEDKKEVYKIFDEEYLNSLSTEELVLLNTFYQNRIQKEKNDLFAGIYYLENLRLLGKNEDSIEQIDEEKIKRVITKRHFLKILFEDIKDKIQDKEKIKEIIGMYRREYETVFNELLPEAINDLAYEAMSDIDMEISCNLNYDMKVILLSKMLEDLHNSTKINWGYIKQDEEKEEHTILIGIDYPGYVPISLHVPKEIFYDTLKSLNQYIIHTYVGNEDIFVEGHTNKKRLLPTNILYRIPDSKKEKIEKLAKSIKKDDTTVKNAKFIHHLNASLKGIMPYHTKEKRENISIEKFKPESEKEVDAR